MTRRVCVVATFSLWLSAASAAENPWRERVADAVAQARATPSVENLTAALDTAYRADDWEAGRTLATDVTPRDVPPALRSRVARALWRAGDWEAAERLADQFSPDANDPVDLHMIVVTSLARADQKRATQAADRLLARADRSALDLMHALSARQAADDYHDALALVREATAKISPDRGYPENLLADELVGLTDFFSAAGPAPLNVVRQHGAAELRRMPIVGLPYCEALINGKGPYKLIVDTGGSIVLSLDEAVVKEIGLPTLAGGSIRGVSGKDAASQTLMDDVRIGDIELHRVVGRTFKLSQAVAYACDGVIGMGVFMGERLTLDYAGERMIVAPSSAAPAAGVAVPLRLIGDAKLIVPAKVDGHRANVFLDTGADGVILSPAYLRGLFKPDQLSEITVPGGAMLGIGAEGAPSMLGSPRIDLEFGQQRFDRVGGLGLYALDTTFGPVLGLQIDVLVGQPAFRRMRSFTVDYGRAKLWIDWLEDAGAGTAAAPTTAPSH
jgi:predicted aspartyl protease